MEKTSLEFKEATIKYVLNELSKDDSKKNQFKKLSGENDLDSAYVIANRYARKYIHFKEKKKKDKFLKEVEKLSKVFVANGNKWVDKNEEISDSQETKTEIHQNEIISQNEIVKDSNEEFTDKIEMADKSISNQISKIMNGEIMIKALINNDIIQLSKEFVEKLGIKTNLIGKKGDVELYYCDGFSVVFQII